MTSSAMILKYYGYNEGVKLNNDGSCDSSFETDPGTLNEWLLDNHGYNKYGALLWPKVAKFAKDANRCLYNGENSLIKFEYTSDFSDEKIKSDLEKDSFPQPGVLKLAKDVWDPIKMKTFTRNHFVVPVGFSDGDLLMNDPERSELSDPPPALNDVYSNDYYRLAYGRFIQTHTDLSYLIVSAEPGLSLNVLDSETSAVPEGSFIDSFSIIANANGEEFSPLHEIYYGPVPSIENKYVIHLENTTEEASLRSIEVSLMDKNGNSFEEVFYRFVGNKESDIVLKINETLDEIEDISVISWEQLTED